MPEKDWITELFKLGKCGGPNSTPFYEWCAKVRTDGNGTSYETQCKDLFESRGSCGYFIKFERQILGITQRCDLGKQTTNYINLPLTDDTLNDVRSHCQYALTGKPFPLWAIIIIVLGIILATGSLSSLIWKYWLKERWNPKGGSAIESRWTDSPVSESESKNVVSQVPTQKPDETPTVPPGISTFPPNALKTAPSSAFASEGVIASGAGSASTASGVSGASRVSGAGSISTAKTDRDAATRRGRSRRDISRARASNPASSSNRSHQSGSHSSQRKRRQNR